MLQDGKYHAPYLRSFLKKLIVEVESTGDVVLDELYEKYTSYMTSLKVRFLVEFVLRKTLDSESRVYLCSFTGL